MPKNVYKSLIAKIFSDRFTDERTEFEFSRDDIKTTAKDLGLKLPKNLGDVIYSVRYRTTMPPEVIRSQPPGMEWIIEGAGRAKYRFRLVKINRIQPNPNLIEIKIPDATPEIVACYSLSDEQALLAKIRYNRLIDIFLGLTSYSLQNHLRTTVKGVGQIEIDELYVGLNQTGCHFIIPVQAKGNSDQLSVVQCTQDIHFCRQRYPGLICRAISSQFVDVDLIVLFELTVCDGNEVKVVQEKHYKLVPSRDITSQDLKQYQVFGR